jgi:hypothetical protein
MTGGKPLKLKFSIDGNTVLCNTNGTIYNQKSKKENQNYSYPWQNNHA